MELIVASAGSYPRIGEASGQEILRAAASRWEKNKGDRMHVEIAENIVTQQVIAEQVEAGVDLITDGMVRWPDPISYFPEHLEGVRIGGLARYYDTPLHFRQPIVMAKLGWIEPSIAEDFMSAQAFCTRPIKVVFTGPITLAKNTTVRSSAYKTLSDLVLDYASVLAREVGLAVGVGATIIQIDEPAVLEPGIDIALIGEALAIVRQPRGSAKILFNSFFGKASRVYASLQTLPVDILGFDLVSDPDLVDMIASDGSDKTLALGLLDGRNTRMEDPFVILEILNRLLPKLQGDICILTTSCGLEFLPREMARKKLERACEIRQLFTREESA